MDNDNQKADGTSADNTDGVLVEPNELPTDTVTSDTAVTSEDTPGVTVTPPDSPLAIQSHQIAPKKSKKGLVAALTVLVVLLAASGTYLLLGRSSEETGSKNAALEMKKDIPHLRYATGSKGWETFYPATDNSSNYQEANIAIFEGLVRYENKTQIVPLLSNGWTNPDDETWVFNLKQGVKFHSGREMMAEDVKLSFEQAKNTANGELYATTMKEVSVTGPYQVTIKTDGPDPILLNKLTNYYVYDTKSGKEADPINGTGAYTLKPGFTPQDNSLELVAFDDYHGGRPHVRSISYIEVQENVQGFYDEGKADIISTIDSGLSEFKSDRSHEKIVLESTSVFLLPLNSQRAGSPLQKLKVRQAVQLAVDPAMTAKIREQTGEPAGQLITDSIPGYNKSITRPERDVAQAKKLLAEAGYPNGVSLMLTYFAPSKETAEELARQMKEAGITLRLDPLNEVKDLGAKAFGGKTDMFFITASSDLLDASDVFANYLNSANYSNSKAGEIFDQANTTLDSKKRLEYLQEISRIMTEDVAVVPVYSPMDDFIVHDPSYVISRDISSNSLGVYFWKVYAK